MSNKTLTKADLANELFLKGGLLNKQLAKNFLNQVFEIISSSLEKGENVKLARFGKFCIRQKEIRPGRNPKHPDQEIPISARKVITFKPSQHIKQVVNRNKDRKSSNE